MIIILGITSGLFVFAAIVLMILRLSFDIRFKAIQKEPNQPPLFRRKVNYQRKIEQTKHIRYLLLTCLAIGIAMMIFIGSFLILANDYHRIDTQNTELNERMIRLESQQKQLIASIPLKNYPEDGIGLNAYDWKKLATETKDPILQDQIETNISQKIVPYFGVTETNVSLADPKRMTLQLNGQAEDVASKETIQKNIDDFAKEAEEIPELAELHVRMITSIGKEKKVVYNVNYSREKNEGMFNKKNVSEQNLKNDGGKG